MSIDWTDDSGHEWGKGGSAPGRAHEETMAATYRAISAHGVTDGQLAATLFADGGAR